MGPDLDLALMLGRANAQVSLPNAERRLGLGQLDKGLPEGLRIPGRDVLAQGVGTSVGVAQSVHSMFSCQSSRRPAGFERVQEADQTNEVAERQPCLDHQRPRTSFGPLPAPALRRTLGGTPDVGGHIPFRRTPSDDSRTKAGDRLHRTISDSLLLR